MGGVLDLLLMSDCYCSLVTRVSILCDYIVITHNPSSIKVYTMML